MADEEKSPFGILPKITTRGDIGAAGLGLAIGYFGDAALHPFGIPPGQASIYSAAAAVGIKNIVQSWHESRQRKAEARVHASEMSISKKQRLEHAAEQMLGILQVFPEGYGKLYGPEGAIGRVKQSLNLMRLELIDADEFQHELKLVAGSDIFVKALQARRATAARVVSKALSASDPSRVKAESLKPDDDLRSELDKP